MARGIAYSVKVDKAHALGIAEVGTPPDSFSTTTPAGLCHRTLIVLEACSFACVSAAVGSDEGFDHAVDLGL